LIPSKRILLGKIVGLFGIKGAVKLESYTEPREGIFSYSPWWIRFSAHERKIEKVRGQAQGKGLIAFLPGIHDRDQATEWIGAEIWIDRSALPPPSPDEYYWTDLEGLEIITMKGVSLGRVSHLFSTGSNDVLVVRENGKERLIPFIFGQFVQNVDLKGAQILVDWDPDF